MLHGRNERSVVVSSIQQMDTCLGLKRNTKSQAIIEAVQLKYHVSVNKLSARGAKHALLGRSVAEYARQYQQLSAYLARYSGTNPFTTLTVYSTAQAVEKLVIIL
jgi:hypothetical protein